MRMGFQASSDIIFNHLSQGLKDKEAEDVDLILYAGDDQKAAAKALSSKPERPCATQNNAKSPANGTSTTNGSTTLAGNFLCFLYEKLRQCTRLKFRKILLLQGESMFAHRCGGG